MTPKQLFDGEWLGTRSRYDPGDFNHEQSRNVRERAATAPARVTLDPPNAGLPESTVSVGELGLSYQVLEDWSDD